MLVSVRLGSLCGSSCSGLVCTVRAESLSAVVIVVPCLSVAEVRSHFHAEGLASPIPLELPANSKVLVVGRPVEAVTRWLGRMAKPPNVARQKNAAPAGPGGGPRRPSPIATRTIATIAHAAAATPCYQPFTTNSGQFSRSRRPKKSPQ